MATEYGYKLDPYRQLRKARGVDAKRQRVRNSHTPSHADQNNEIIVQFPNLGRDDVIVPGSSKLSFKVNLTSATGGNQDVNRTIVNNLGRAIVSKIDVKLEGESVFTLEDADVFTCYQDLWKTTKERKNAAYQGIQSEAVRKIRIDAGNKGSAAKDVAIEKQYGNKFYIPLDFEMLSSHNPFFQYELKDRLSYELTFNRYGKVVVSTDTTASYGVSEIHLEFETVKSSEIATPIRNQYNGKSVVMYDKIIRRIMETKNKSDTIWNFSLAPQANSMKGILILFIDSSAGGGGESYARDSEKFYNPKIKKVSVTLDGVPNQLYSSGLLPHHHFEEIQKYFAEGKYRTIPHVTKELELADMELADYLTEKYGLWLDMRSTDDPELHGSGRKLEGDHKSIHIEIEKEAETAGELTAYVYSIQDAQLNIENGKLMKMVY